MLGYFQCSFVALVPLVSLGYVYLAPCTLKVVEVSVCACTCISRSLATGDCLPIEQSSHALELLSSFLYRCICKSKP